MTTTSSIARHLNAKFRVPVDFNRRYVQVDTAFVCLTVERKPYGMEITYLWVCKAFRSAGLGGDLMSAVCQWADRRRTKLWLWAKPFRSPNSRSVYGLAAYYAQFGFEPLRRETRTNFHRRVRMRRG